MQRQLDEKTLVDGQIAPGDVATLKALGVTMIVNNRPDGEAPGQPSGAEIEAAADAAGVGYRYIPVAGGFASSQVQELSDVLAANEGDTLLYCASGTRSTYLWALARAQAGDDAEGIIGKAAAAGYDLNPLRAYLG